ncbi:unnamed protein product [Rhizopus stolonifer]
MDHREIDEEDTIIPEEPYHDNVEESSDSDDSDEPEASYVPTTRLQTNPSYASSVISTQSAPPPYELYPPAKTAWGRFFNWMRKIPRLNTHQAIYLPTLSAQQPTARRRGPSIQTYWSYYYNIRDRIPRLTLPPMIAENRIILLCFSFFALLLFSFLLFCSIFFAPGDLPEPVFPDKATTTQLRFLTLNIFMRPPLIRNNWSDYKDQRLAYIERYVLPEYDVIVFQESFGFASRRKDHLIRTARNLGFNYHLESARKYPWDFGVDGGLLLLSRFPIRESHRIEYPRGQHADWLSVKGALHALIELNPDRQMHVYTTHTQASYDLDNVINPDDTATRLTQFALLRSFVQETTDKDQHPILIAGDLNVDAAVHHGSITQRSVESSPEYVQMVNRLKLDDLKDVVYEAYGHHPVTFGDYTVNSQDELVPAETVLTDWDQLLTVQSIDRIFWVARNTTLLNPQPPNVEKFWVQENSLMTEEEKNQVDFTQISDHYGLSCTIKIV